jgi:TPR repeat protein
MFLLILITLIALYLQKNKAEAVRLLDRTCAQGDSDSCYFLGGLHLKQRKLTHTSDG